MIEFLDGADDDVVAEFRREVDIGDGNVTYVKVTFLSAPRLALNGKDFDVLMWDSGHIRLVIADDYLDMISSKLATVVAESFPKVMEEYAAEKFAEMLSDILPIAIKNNMDKAHDLLLDNIVKSILDDE